MSREVLQFRTLTLSESEFPKLVFTIELSLGQYFEQLSSSLGKVGFVPAPNHHPLSFYGGGAVARTDPFAVSGRSWDSRRPRVVDCRSESTFLAEAVQEDMGQLRGQGQTYS